MFTFRAAAETGERLTQRIRRILSHRPAMHVGELRMRLGEDVARVQAELDAMVKRDEIRRLRPVDYHRDDYDFFRLNRPHSVRMREKRSVAFADGAGAFERPIGDGTVWLADEPN